MTRMSFPRVPAAWLVFTAALCGQQMRPIPPHAQIADGHESTELPFGAPGFRTQILVPTRDLAVTGGTIHALRMRVDRPSAPLASQTVPNVTVQISQTPFPVGTLTTTFATNVTGTPVTVFQGSVALPAQGAGNAGPLPWNVVVAFQTPFPFTTAAGSLLIDIVGNNPPHQRARYWLDAVEAGGSAVPFGRPGDNPTSDRLHLIASTGPDLVPMRITVGNTVEYSSTLAFTNPPGALMLGFAAFPTPIDLRPFGAPTHELYLDPLVYVPHVWQRSFIGWYSTVPVPIPPRPSLVDTLLFAQSLLVDANANAAGLLLSRAIETRIGDPNATVPLQQLDAFDPAAPQGTLLEFGAPGRFGGAALLFEGQFQ